MTPLEQLFARPIAHRGLHNLERGVVENSPSAALAATARGYAIECDIQLSADGEAMVFHDFTLERLTSAHGRVDAVTAGGLKALALRGGPDRIMSLDELIVLVDGRVPIICEIKSRFDGDFRCGRRVAEILAGRPIPAAVKSFDPEVVVDFRQHAAALSVHAPVGVVAMAHFRDREVRVDKNTKRTLDAFLHWDRSRPDFLSFCVDDLPHSTPYLLRQALGIPVMAWTVRQAKQAAAARLWADQIIFEGESPPLF